MQSKQHPDLVGEGDKGGGRKKPQIYIYQYSSIGEFQILFTEFSF